MNHTLPKNYAVGALLAGLATLASTGSSLAQVTIEQVVITGNTAPDGDGIFPTLDNNFGLPRLNNLGQAAFTGALFGSSGGSGTDTGIFRGTATPGSLTQIARESDALLGAAGGKLNSLFTLDIALNNAGQVAFTSGINGSVSFSSGGVFRGDGGALTTIGRDNDAGPVPIGNLTSNIGRPVINDNGEIAFDVMLNGTFSGLQEEAVFRGDGNSLVQIARQGQAAPGGGSSISDFRSLSLNSSGEVLFGADAPNNSDIILKGNGPRLIDVVRNGDAAPDGAGGLNGVFNRFSSTTNFDPSFNESGNAAFSATTSNNNPEDEGLFRTNGSLVTQVVRGGDDTPTNNGFFDDDFFQSVAINNSNDVAFWADLFGTVGGVNDDTGLYVTEGNTIVKVAREGEATPGGIGSYQNFLGFAYNDQGQVGFLADIDFEDGGTALDSIGLFLYKGSSVVEVVREGDILFGNAVTALSFASGSGSEGHIRSGLNDQGSLAFRFELSDTRAGIAIARTALDGDLNGDGFVGVDDLNLVLINWNQNVTPGDLGSGDPSGEGFVGVDDLNIVLVNWNSGTPPSDLTSAMIPEPGALALLSLSGVVLLGRKTMGTKPTR